MTGEIPKIIFLFGVAGAGKSFTGRELSERLGYHHYELDRDLTPAIRQAIADRRPFTDEMRDEFFHVVCQRINEVVSVYPKSIFTQGAYRERHRALVRAQIPGIEFVWVQAPYDVVLERLLRRGEAVTAEYAAVLERAFEVPTGGRVLLNDRCAAEDLFQRFKGLFSGC